MTKLHKYFYIAFTPLLLAGVLFPFFIALAQSGSVPPTDPTAAPASVATSTTAAPATPRAVTPRSTPSAGATLPIQSNPTSTATQNQVPTVPAPQESGNLLLWIALAAVAILPFGFLI